MLGHHFVVTAGPCGTPPSGWNGLSRILPPPPRRRGCEVPSAKKEETPPSRCVSGSINDVGATTDGYLKTPRQDQQQGASWMPNRCDACIAPGGLTHGGLTPWGLGYTLKFSGRLKWKFRPNERGSVVELQRAGWHQVRRSGSR